jgi:hypothetical protein
MGECSVATMGDRGRVIGVRFTCHGLPAICRESEPDPARVLEVHHEPLSGTISPNCVR